MKKRSQCSSYAPMTHSVIKLNHIFKENNTIYFIVKCPEYYFHLGDFSGLIFSRIDTILFLNFFHLFILRKDEKRKSVTYLHD